MKRDVSGISSFQKNLSWWVLGCMAAGVAIGRFFPAVPSFLNKLQIAGISLPIAVLIWEKPQGIDCNLGHELAYQALYDVWNCLAVSVCAF